MKPSNRKTPSHFRRNSLQQNGRSSRPSTSPGNARQRMKAYLERARDAISAGDRVLAENFYQHAEHYLRVAQSQES
jgi:phage shock protein A